MTRLLPLLLLLAACQAPEETPRRLEVLFLGHESRHHDAQSYAPMLGAALATHGINLSYSNDAKVLNRHTLANFDVLVLYAHHDSITIVQEKALLDFVASGRGFVPVHAASYCFRNSDAFVELVGGQFERHGTGTFRAEIVQPEHAAIEGFEPFETWDETYVHTRHAKDRTVLMVRREAGHAEPWTWTRRHGKGRVFYTAYGHDERTWGHEGFHDLMRRGIEWAAGEAAAQRAAAYAIAPLEYLAHDSIPNYEQRDPPPMFQLPLPPEASMQHIQVPPGFSLTLFAAEPDIVNPMAMAWDDRGRLLSSKPSTIPTCAKKRRTARTESKYWRTAMVTDVRIRQRYLRMG